MTDGTGNASSGAAVRAGSIWRHLSCRTRITRSRRTRSGSGSRRGRMPTSKASRHSPSWPSSRSSSRGAPAGGFPRLWGGLALIFGALALGPFVHVAGINTHVPGPWAFLRYVPVIGLARTPSRFSIVLMLAVADPLCECPVLAWTTLAGAAAGAPCHVRRGPDLRTAARASSALFGCHSPHLHPRHGGPGGRPGAGTAVRRTRRDVERRQLHGALAIFSDGARQAADRWIPVAGVEATPVGHEARPDARCAHVAQ